MKKTTRRFSAFIFVVTMIFSVALTVSAAAAAWDYFSAVLPAKQGDAEVSTVSRTTTKTYFTVEIAFFGSGADAVHVWTEDAFWGTNFSSPSNSIAISVEENIAYTRIPAVGVNVTLNIDNPVYSQSGYSIEGRWTPN